jgi:hypothetical protein
MAGQVGKALKDVAGQRGPLASRGNGVRSRIAQTMSNGRSLSTRADASRTRSLKTVISARPETLDQSAVLKCNI